MPAILEAPDETSAAKDAIMGEEVKKRRLTRRRSAAGERGSAPQSWDAEARGHGCGGRSRGLQKEARRILQEHHAVDGHHHQAVPADRTGHAVSLRRPLRLNHHGHGTRRREKHAGAHGTPLRLGDPWRYHHRNRSRSKGCPSQSTLFTKVPFCHHSQTREPGRQPCATPITRNDLPGSTRQTPPHDHPAVTRDAPNSQACRFFEHGHQKPWGGTSSPARNYSSRLLLTWTT